MTRKHAFTTAAALVLLTLGACSGASDEPSPMDNTTDTAQSDNDDLATPTPEPAPPVAEPTETVNTSVADDTPPPAPAAPDEQMMDDASATGMTARTSRNEPSTDPTPSAAPVEDK